VRREGRARERVICLARSGSGKPVFEEARSRITGLWTQRDGAEGVTRFQATTERHWRPVEGALLARSGVKSKRVFWSLVLWIGVRDRGDHTRVCAPKSAQSDRREMR